jgi:hypothetical protein
MLLLLVLKYLPRIRHFLDTASETTQLLTIWMAVKAKLKEKRNLAAKVRFVTL